MSLYGMMRTGVSGMNAQANRLSTTADNIANSDTTGYKRSSAEFSTLIMPHAAATTIPAASPPRSARRSAQQGVLQYTTSVSDLAVNGNGFFVVQDPSGTPFLTRAGAFVPDAQGRLVNAAGFQLMAYSYANGTPAATVPTASKAWSRSSISDQELTATPSTTGIFTGNLPAGATPVAAGQPARPPTPPTAQYTSKSSMVAYDNLGNKKLLDVYFTNTGAGTWEVSVFDQSEGDAGHLFPYHRRRAGSARPDLRHHHRQADRHSAHGIPFTVPGGASPRSRPVQADPARHRLHRLRRQGQRQRAEHHRQDPDRQGRHHLRPVSRTARPRRSTRSRWPTCRAPTSSTRCPATSMRKHRLRRRPYRLRQ